MIRKVHIVFLVLCMAMAVRAQVVQEIPLYPYAEGLYFAPAQTQDDPGRSTPDPTDPTQFRATLTDNTLTVENQTDHAVMVLVTDLFSNQRVVNLECRQQQSVILQHQGQYSLILVNDWVCLAGRFSIYENLPADDRWFIYTAGIVRDIRVYDLSGHQIPVTRQYNSLDLSSLPSGMYIIHIETSAGLKSVKILRP